MIQACLCLLAGAYAVQLSSITLDSDLRRVVFVAIFLGMLSRRIRMPTIVLAGAGLFLLAATDVVDSRIAAEFVGDSLVAKVRIADFPKRKAASVAMLVETLDNPRVPRRVRLTWQDAPVALRLGDTWQLEIRLRRPRGTSNPGGFDYEALLLREQVGAVGYVVNGHRNRLLRSPMLSTGEATRQRVVSRIGELIPEAETAAVLSAISVGARHLITQDQWHRYALTGTSHLMAISGLHIGLAAAGGYFLLAAIAGMLRWRGNQHVLATSAALVVAAGYAVVSGLAVPAQRAGIMLAIVASVILLRRPIRPATIVATACLVMLVLNPLATMAPGFKLSFAAVLVLIWIARGYRGESGHDTALRPLLALRSLGLIQVMLLLGLLPLTLLLFGRVAFAAPLVNLVAVPIFSFVTVPFCLGGLLLDGAVAFAGDRALLIAASSLQLIEKLIAVFAALPGADFSPAMPAGIAWLLVVLPLAWVLLPAGWPGRSVALVAVAALVQYQPVRPPTNCADVDVLDVGQGLAVVVSTRQHIVVFDSGPAYRGGGSAAGRIILPLLRRRGVDRIDKVVISHSDLDHAGGARELLAGVEVRDLLSGEPLADAASAERPCVAGDSWDYDGVGFRIVHPPAGTALEGNDRSCVLEIAAGDHRMMLSGDIERPAEAQLLRRQQLRAVDAVVVPHHGSRTSSSLPFVHALRPAWALVSAGYGNRWGFPKEDVVARWQGAGARVLATATSGAIGMRLCADGGIISVTRQRTLQRRIWHE